MNLLLQGAKRGYNSKKKGRSSNHALLAFVAEVKMVADFWLRPGNSSSSNNIIAFLEETFLILKGKTIGLFRADLGFYQKEVFDWLEGENVQYIIAVRMYINLRIRPTNTIFERL